MKDRGKKYLEAAMLVDLSRRYMPAEAIHVDNQASFVKFVETV